MLTSIAFWQSAGERAIKTVAQTALALLGTSQLVSVVEINWVEIGGVSVLAGILSLLTSVAIPATDTKESVRRESEARASAKAAQAKKVAAPKTATKKATKK
jgi:hypothetical protein